MARSFELKAIISAVDKLSPALKNIQRATRVTRKSISDIGSAGRELTQTLTGIVAPLGGVLGALGLGGIGGTAAYVVKTSAEFEKFQTILETVEGSAEKAKASMGWVAEFATKTPYELNQVTDAFVKLKSYGIDPQTGALQAAGDAAAAMGKPLEQAVEALADAMNGENERLRDLGITASKTGDTIVYRWSENGKTMAAKAKANNKAQIQAVIQGIWNSRYAGAMDKLSRTWDGMWSNIQDTVARFALAIGDAGLFPFLKGEMKGLLDLLNRMAEDGSLQTMAKAISDELVGAFKELKGWVMSVDWSAVWQDVKAVAAGVRDVVSALGGIKGIAIGFGLLLGAQILAPMVAIGGALFRMLPLLGQFFAWLVPLNYGAIFTGIAAGVMKAVVAVKALGAAFLATPWGAVIAAVALVAVSLYKNWDAIVAYVGQAWERIKSVFEVGWFAGLTQIWLEIFQGFLNGIVGLIKDITPDVLLPDKLKNFKFSFAEDVAAARTASAGAPAAAPQRGLASAGAQRLNGELAVRFENAPAGMRVQSGRTNQPGVSFNPDVGYSSIALGMP